MDLPRDPEIIPFPVPQTPVAYEEEPEITIAPQEVSVTEWLEFWRYLEGRPISFDDQTWIKPMLDCPDSWQVWQTGRQVAKSTSIASLMTCYGCNVAHLKQLYVTPTFKQTTVFSKDRLRPAIYDSPNIVDLYIDKNCTDNVFAKGLATPSDMLMRHCYLTADSARGASAHVLFLDELQLLGTELIPVLEETLSAAGRSRELASEGYADVRRYCGTPLSYDSALETSWSRSTQNEWIVPCRGCRKENILDEDVIGPKGLICKACGHDLDWGEGQWVITGSPTSRWTGWHVSQLMATKRDENDSRGWIPWEDILEKQRTYTAKLFYNEVLGVAYDSGLRPITKAQIMACCEPAYSLDDLPIGVSECFGGLDWQMEEDSYSSYTVFTIYTIVNQRFQLRYVKKFVGREAADPDFVLQHIVEKMEEYHVKVIGCDRGVGHKENFRIRNNVPNGDMRVIEYQYVVQTEEIKWVDDIHAFRLDKPSRMEAFFEALKQRWVWFPKWEEFEPYHMDVYTIYTEYDKFFRKQKYLHKEPDDFFQSSLYAWEAMNYYYQYSVNFGKPVIAGVE